MQRALGRPLEEALASLPQEQTPQVVFSAAPVRSGQARQESTPRVILCRQGQWIAARFLDGAPREAGKEEP